MKIERPSGMSRKFVSNILLSTALIAIEAGELIEDPNVKLIGLDTKGTGLILQNPERGVVRQLHCKRVLNFLKS